MADGQLDQEQDEELKDTNCDKDSGGKDDIDQDEENRESHQLLSLWLS